MGSFVNATKEERSEMALNLYTALAKHYADFKGIENATITIYKGKEEKICITK